jgi:acyl carrier protein
VDQLGLDSLALLSLTVALENHFEVCLEPDEDEPLVCVGDVVRLLARARADAGEDASAIRPC